MRCAHRRKPAGDGSPARAALSWLCGLWKFRPPSELHSRAICPLGGKGKLPDGNITELLPAARRLLFPRQKCAGRKIRVPDPSCRVSKCAFPSKSHGFGGRLYRIRQGVISRYGMEGVLLFFCCRNYSAAVSWKGLCKRHQSVVCRFLLYYAFHSHTHESALSCLSDAFVPPDNFPPIFVNYVPGNFCIGGASKSNC